VRGAIGLLGRAAAESGRLGHGAGGHGRGDRRRRAFMLTTLLDRTGQGEPSARICKWLRIGALERGNDSHGLELFTFASTTGGGSQ